MYIFSISLGHTHTYPHTYLTLPNIGKKNPYINRTILAISAGIHIEYVCMCAQMYCTVCAVCIALRRRWPTADGKICKNFDLGTVGMYLI